MVTIRAVAGGGIVEGDYTTWTYKWLWAPVAWLDPLHTVFHIDEVNNLFYLWWGGASDGNRRFGVYNLADHSTVFESPAGSHYTYNYNPYLGAGDYSFYLGVCTLTGAAISRSHQTYMLLCRGDAETMEVWRAGVKLWSRKASLDTLEASEEPYGAAISLTGKYIMACLDTSLKLILYEGT